MRLLNYYAYSNLIGQAHTSDKYILTATIE